MKPTNKRYEIETFEQLVNLASKDNFESLSTDLFMWFAYVVQAFESIRKSNPKECEGKTNWEIAKCHFIWVDDGEIGANSIVIKNELNGEVTTYDLKKPKADSPQ